MVSAHSCEVKMKGLRFAIMVIGFLLLLGLASYGLRASCTLQMVAGGARYCQGFEGR
jgi:hypothetical protein